MSIIMTVTGPIDSAELGPTMTHEHLLVDLRVHWREPANDRSSFKALRDVAVTPRILATLRKYPFTTTRDNLFLGDETLAIAEAEMFYRSGGSTIVDLTNIGLSRDPVGLYRIARATGLNIVMGGGCYVENAHPEWVADATVDQLTELFIADFYEGVDGTGIRTGIIGEVGISGFPKGSLRMPSDKTGHMTPNEEKVLRASGRAAVATGQSVSVHVDLRSLGALKAIDVLEEEGLAGSRQVMCHIDFIDDLDYHREIMSRGATVEYSSFGREYYEDGAGISWSNDAARVEKVTQLVGEGFADRIVFAQDVCMKMDLRSFGGNGYAHVLTTILPRCKRAGVSAEALQQILVENPRRLLTLDLDDGQFEELMARPTYPLFAGSIPDPDDIRSIARNGH